MPCKDTCWRICLASSEAKAADSGTPRVPTPPPPPPGALFSLHSAEPQLTMWSASCCLNAHHATSSLDCSVLSLLTGSATMPRHGTASALKEEKQQQLHLYSLYYRAEYRPLKPAVQQRACRSDASCCPERECCRRCRHVAFNGRAMAFKAMHTNVQCPP